MFKLMKYEFRKTRTVLMVMGIALIVLELLFLYGIHTDSDGAIFAGAMLLSWLTFAAYAYLLIAAIVSYSRELRDKTGYLAFMTPVSPLGIVASKLLYAVLAAIVAAALFGTAAYFDLRLLFKNAGIGADEVRQADLMLGMFGGVQLTLEEMGRFALFVGIEVLGSFITTVCAAFLAITLSATLLENQKGFLRGLLSFVFFALLSWGIGAITSGVNDALDFTATTLSEVLSLLTVPLLIQLAVCALFAWLSAWLLDRKVSL